MEKNDHSDAAGRLREARKASGLSYGAFAEAIGLSRGTLSKYENGKLAVPKKIEMAVAGLRAGMGGRNDG